MKNMWYWVVGEQYGIRVIHSPFATEEEARNWGLSYFGANFEVYVLDTRDMGEAKKRLRAQIFSENGDLVDSMRRMRISRG